ncbi:MAG: ATP-binding cassette domain-containing protein [Myxococcota bacterium]
MKNRNDSDARGILATTKASWAARSLERGVSRAGAALERVDQTLQATALERRLDPKALGLVLRETPQRVLAGGHWDALMAGERVLARDVTLWLERGDRVHIAGPNGAGKTTLLNALLATKTLPDDALLVQPQELPPAATASLLAEIRASPPDVRGRTLSLVAALGADPERLLATERPSPGEARKLHLALGIARGVAALVLDEPTNHLDLPSIARLEEALAAWPGTLVLVTHDAHLAARTTTTVWTLGDGRVQVSARA